MGIENTMKRDRITNGSIKMFSTDGVEVLISVVTGLATGIVVSLLFEFRSWLKNGLARKAQIAYIRNFLHEQKELIEKIPDQQDMNVRKEELQFARIESVMRQANIIVETRSPNLLNEQRSEILGVISGISGIMTMLKATNRVPDTKFLFESLQEIEDIEWLKVN